MRTVSAIDLAIDAQIDNAPIDALVAGGVQLSGCGWSTGRVLEKFSCLTGDVVALLTHSTWRGVDGRWLTGHMIEPPPKSSDQCTPGLSIQIEPFQDQSGAERGHSIFKRRRRSLTQLRKVE